MTELLQTVCKNKASEHMFEYNQAMIMQFVEADVISFMRKGMLPQPLRVRIVRDGKIYHFNIDKVISSEKRYDACLSYCKYKCLATPNEKQIEFVMQYWPDSCEWQMEKL